MQDAEGGSPRRIRRAPTPQARAVTGDDGELVGLITPENLGEMLMVHEALARAPRPAPPADAPPRTPRVAPAER